MLHCSWDMARDRCNGYFLFWGIFCPFTHLTAQKIKKNFKKAWIYHHFTYVYKKLWSVDVHFLIYGAWWMDRQTDECKKWHRGGCPTSKILKRMGLSIDPWGMPDRSTWRTLHTCYLFWNSVYAFLGMSKRKSNSHLKIHMCDFCN